MWRQLTLAGRLLPRDDFPLPCGSVLGSSKVHLVSSVPFNEKTRVLVFDVLGTEGFSVEWLASFPIAECLLQHNELKGNV